MSYKGYVKSKVPERYKETPEFRVFLSMISKRNIRNTDELKDYLEKEIKNCNEWMKKNRKQSKEGTMGRWLGYYSRKLDFLNLIKKKIAGYL